MDIIFIEVLILQYISRNYYNETSPLLFLLMSSVELMFHFF